MFDDVENTLSFCIGKKMIAFLNYLFLATLTCVAPAQYIRTYLVETNCPIYNIFVDMFVNPDIQLKNTALSPFHIK